MGASDPHIHVDVSAIHADAFVRDTMASTFGLVGDLPAVVTTGCGLEVPYAMTSPLPQSVTCLACREHAHQQHLRYAEQIERWSAMTGMNLDPREAARAAREHRGLAARFADTGR